MARADASAAVRPVAGRIVVAQAADDRAHLPHDRIGDDIGGLLEQAPAFGDHGRSLERRVTGQRADREVTVLLPDVIETREPVDVDEDRRSGQPEAHGRDQALAARQHPGIEAVLGEQGRGFVDRPWFHVVERCWEHAAPSVESSSAPRCFRTERTLWTRVARPGSQGEIRESGRRPCCPENAP